VRISPTLTRPNCRAGPYQGGSPVEVVQAHLNRIEALNPKLNATVTVVDDALRSAKAAEAAVVAGGELGPLHGVPFTVKDSIDTAGVLTQRGSPIFKGRMPDADATSVARMKKAGGIAGLLKHRRQDPQKYLKEGECADRRLSSYQSVFETTTSSAVKPTSSVSSSQKQGVYYAVCAY
jgi:amidase